MTQQRELPGFIQLTGSEVRRAALYNLPCNPRTLPHILARTRDIDPILRRTVYHGSLSAAALPDSRILTIAQREDAVKHGLGDREGSVRKAAAGMLGGWVDQTGGDLIEVGYTLCSSLIGSSCPGWMWFTAK
jgi:condensin complex subunit 3